MTAEVVVMNKLGVAMAADSAVTISRNKVFNSAEKLFVLDYGRPIGMMIYEDAEFMQVPWEVIVKKYRDYANGKTFDSLEEHAEDFLKFLGDPKSELFDEENIITTFRQLANYYFYGIREYIGRTVFQRIQDNASKISFKEISEIVDSWITIYYDDWNESEDYYPEEISTKIKGKLKTKNYHEIVEKVINQVFLEYPLSDENKDKLEEISHLLILKTYPLDYYTGLVFAGYGKKDIYPSCVDYTVENYFDGNLKYRKENSYSITPTVIGRVIPFAQQKEVRNILDGIHADFQEELTKELGNIFSKSSLGEVVEGMKGLRKTRKDKILSAIDKLKTDKQDQIIKKVGEKFKESHTDSILNTVSILPKDELANMAESLVNITSFVRKVSMDTETVGGPIDVAVISKKDGFIWINRKHYFDSKYNPQHRPQFSN